MARAKNTGRAEARRRHRAAHAQSPEQQLGADTAAPSTDALEENPARPGLRLPNIREDVKALPEIFRTKPLLWLPAALMLAGLAVGLGVTTGLGLDPTTDQVARLFFQLTLVPPAIPVLMAGFIAPRASYLVGLLFGALQGILLFVLVSAGPEAAGATASVGAFNFAYAALTGMLYGGLAGWYRGFLQQTKRRQQAMRAARAASREAKAREERREARRQARQVPR